MPNQEQSKDAVPRKDKHDHGSADDKPMGGDSAPLGPPREILSDRNGPSDPDNRKK